MKKLNALKNKKGFTLIEIIVVLVIIAILAAATVPAMLGFVNEARGKAFASEARLGLVAAQAVVTELLATGETLKLGADLDTQIKGAASWKNMVDGDVEGSFSGFVVGTNNRVTDLVYLSADGKTQVTIDSGKTTVSKVTPPAGG